MKTKYITIGLALLLFSTALQAQIIERYKVDSPFAKYGHKVYVGTSGDGELLEFHDQDSVVRIGAALYHVWRDTVIGFVFEDEEFEDTSGVGHLPILSVDPKCDRYYWITPYAYCNNNPLKRIDPNGMDVWEIDEKGNLINRIKNQKDFFLVRKADGSTVESTAYENGTIMGKTAYTQERKNPKTDHMINVTVDMYGIQGNKPADELMQFFADHTQVEWSRFGLEKEYNAITTSHRRLEEFGASDIINGKGHYLPRIISALNTTIFDHIHPSGGEMKVSDADRLLVKKLELKNPNISTCIILPNKLPLYYHSNSSKNK